eukprot:CAMPEP_0172553222 /NCGR_PEP_ID=MMETSP1067-20121228/49491_1 /TAXON_ID=265564 ORGANISM="Thalassiosira punctigera, Strain Tpunct2005C2" /NCGR_SAMPLE_ID=MMETSP1067 /ASSEMBLY_ACC=CAM_ASM_000444 /LENGTH=331 /DNA_ID=CAMNT_0013341369 /DNA_START=20 /DNA_END=1015 /DNA_ORIENTATION=-
MAPSRSSKPANASASRRGEEQHQRRSLSPSRRHATLDPAKSSLAWLPPISELADEGFHVASDRRGGGSKKKASDEGGGPNMDASSPRYKVSMKYASDKTAKASTTFAAQRRKSFESLDSVETGSSSYWSGDSDTEGYDDISSVGGSSGYSSVVGGSSGYSSVHSTKKTRRPLPSPESKGGQLLRRRMKMMLGVVVMAALSARFLNLVGAGLRRARVEAGGEQHQLRDRQLPQEASEDSQQYDQSQEVPKEVEGDGQLVFRTLPGGGSVMEMVSLSQGNDGANSPEGREKKKERAVSTNAANKQQNSKMSELAALRERNRQDHFGDVKWGPE